MSISPEQARAFATFLGYPESWAIAVRSSRELRDQDGAAFGPYRVNLILAAPAEGEDGVIVLIRVRHDQVPGVCYEQVRQFNGTFDDSIHGLQNVSNPAVAQRAVDLLWPGVRIIRTIKPRRGRPASIRPPETIRRMYQELLDSNGKRPSQDDVADALFVSRRRFKAQLSLLRQLGLFAWNELTALNSTVVNENERVG